MIYITGDTHGEYFELAYRLSRWPLKRGDTVIIAGDFGFIWDDDMRALDMVKEMPYTIAFVDGNHENFDMLSVFPAERWKGGKVHRIAANVFHLMRGQLFEIEGTTIFTMGGAYSIDKAHRTEGRSWWKQEKPTAEDYRTADETLERCGKKADIVVTHTLPQSLIPMLGIIPDEHDEELTVYLERLYREMDFRMWFGGHFHMDKLIDKNVRVLYHDVVPIDERITG